MNYSQIYGTTPSSSLPELIVKSEPVKEDVKMKLALIVRERWADRRVPYAKSLEGKINNRLAGGIIDFCDRIIYKLKF